MYHEYNYGGRLHRRSYASSGHFDISGWLIPSDSELGQLRAELMRRIGQEAFYQFHLGLGSHIVSNYTELRIATRRKLEELDQLDILAYSGTQLPLPFLTVEIEASSSS